jgi:hypothetical protein
MTPTEKKTIIDEADLTVGGIKTFSAEFPMGRIWNRMILRFTMVLANTTGTGALTDALLRIVENILIETSRDGNVANVPGRFFHRRAQVVNGGTPPVLDAFAVTAGTYRWQIIIDFADPRMQIPSWSALDTRRYKSVSLSLSMGGVSRLMSAVGDSSITSLKLSVDLEMPKGMLHPNLAPKFLPYFKSKPGVDPNVRQALDLDVADDLAVKRLFLLTTDSNSAPWQGGADSAVLNKISIEDDNGFLGVQGVKDDMIQRSNVLDYSIDGGALITGLYVVDYVTTGDIDDAVLTAGKSKYEVNWTNDVPAGKFVHSAIDAVRGLKPIFAEV